MKDEVKLCACDAPNFSCNNPISSDECSRISMLALPQVEKLGGASMMTEWGGNDCGGSEEQQAECSFVQGVADRHLQSWTLWGMNSHGIANGSFTPQQAEVLSRTYAQAVAGSVVNMTFEQRSRAFELCFEMDGGIVEPTVIYIAAALFYKGAPVISTTPNVIAHLRCYIPPPPPPPLTSHTFAAATVC